MNYKGINVKKEFYSIIKYIEDVDKYREKLERLSSSWDIFVLLGQLGDINNEDTKIDKIDNDFISDDLNSKKIDDNLTKKDIS